MATFQMPRKPAAAATTRASSSSTSVRRVLPANANHIIHQSEAPSSHMSGLAGITPHTLAKSISELTEGVYGSAAKGAQQVRELIYLMESQDEELDNVIGGDDGEKDANDDDDETRTATTDTAEATPGDQHLHIPGEGSSGFTASERRRSSRKRSSAAACVVPSMRQEQRRLTHRRVSDTIRQLAMLDAKADADLRYKIQPWRSAFQQWVEELRISIRDLSSHSAGAAGISSPYSCSFNVAVPVELFVRRVIDATKPSPAALPTTKDAFSARALQNVPHLLTTSAAIFAFDQYLLPLLGPHYELLARRAFHELVMAVYQAPPPQMPPAIASLTAEDYAVLCHATMVGLGNSQSLATRNAEQRLRKLAKQQNCTLSQPTTVGSNNKDSSSSGTAAAEHSSEASSVYVNTTFVSRFHDLKHIFVVLRDRYRQQTVVQERQDNILARTIVRWQQQTLSTILAAWNQYTKRAKKLRQRYGKVILSLSETATTTRAIKLWRNSARKVVRDAEEKKATLKSPEEISSVARATTEHISLRHKLQAQVNLKQTRAAMIERAKGDNAKSLAERAKREAMIRNLQDRYGGLADGVATLINTLLPAADSPLQQLDVEDEDVVDDFRVANDTDDELSDDNAKLLLWVARVGAADTHIAGRKLYQVLSKLAAKDKSLFSVGVIARSQHLIPVLRLLITLHSPAAVTRASTNSSSGGSSPGSKGGKAGKEPELDMPFADFFGDDDHDNNNQSSFKLDDVAPELTRLASQRKIQSRNLAKQQTILGHAAERRKSGAFMSEDPMRKQTTFGSFRIPAHEGADLYGNKTATEMFLHEQQEALFANERKKQLNALVSPLTSCETVTHVANYILALTNRLTKTLAIGVSKTGATSVSSPSSSSAAKKTGGSSSRPPQHPTQQQHQHQEQQSQLVKLLPATFSKYLVYNSEHWRNLVLAYLQYTQLSPNCSVFKTVGSSTTATTATSTDVNSPNVVRAQAQARRTTMQASATTTISARTRAVGFSAVPAQSAVHAMTPHDARDMLAQRMNQRRALAARAQSADEAYNGAIGAIVTSTLDGGDIALEARRVYETFCDANQSLAGSTRVKTDFLASKMRIVFGRDSAFWRPATTNRVIESPKQMEEYVATVASISPLSPLDLCAKLLVSCDDCDLFFCALESEEIHDAMEQHLSDLALIFSLYAEGDAPMYKFTKDAWMLLNNPWIENQTYNLSQAEYVFDLVFKRCEKGIRGREADLLTEELEFDPSPSLIPGYGMVGLDMDAFCQALCIVTQFKIPNPFQPLESKFHAFTETWLIPMVGAKSKLVRRKSSVGGGRRQSAAAPLQFPIPMHLQQSAQHSPSPSGPSPNLSGARRSVSSIRTSVVTDAGSDEMAEDPSSLSHITSFVSDSGGGGSGRQSSPEARRHTNSMSPEESLPGSRCGSLVNRGGHSSSSVVMELNTSTVESEGRHDHSGDEGSAQTSPKKGGSMKKVIFLHS